MVMIPPEVPSPWSKVSPASSRRRTTPACQATRIPPPASTSARLVPASPRRVTVPWRSASRRHSAHTRGPRAAVEHGDQQRNQPKTSVRHPDEHGHDGADLLQAHQKTTTGGWARSAAPQASTAADRTAA